MKIKFNYKGIHSCDAVVLCCIDFRFWRETVEFAEKELELKSFDFPSLPGAAKAINECIDGDISMSCVGVPCELHHVKKIIIINHQDCGAYGGSGKFQNGEEEQKFHEEELQKAKEKLMKKYPDKEYVLVYARLVDDKENIEFVTVS